MSPFVSVVHQKSYSWKWLAAMIAALSFHILVVIVFYWQPAAELAIAPAAAPKIYTVSMVSAPKTPITEHEEGPLQQASTPTLQQHVDVKPPAKVIKKVKPLTKAKSEYVVKDTSTEKITEKLVTDSQVTEKQDKPTEQPKIEQTKPRTIKKKTSVNEQYVKKSSAPVAINAKQNELATAPQAGALNELDSQAVVNWQNNLAAHLERRKRYPRTAKIRGQQGVPWVTFTMDRQGHVVTVKLHRASGISALDREVVALIKRSQPLPFPPDNLPDSSLTVTLPVAFFIQ